MIQASLARQQEIRDLPVEDTVWQLSLSSNAESSSLEDDTVSSAIGQAVLVVDRSGQTLGVCQVTDCFNSLEETCRTAVCVSCLSPLSGQSRRPRHVVISDQLSSSISLTFLTDLGLKLGLADIGNQMYNTQETARLRECWVCGKRGSSQLFTTCAGCQAVMYCSQTCKDVDWSKDEDTDPSCHKVCCPIMKQYMDTGSILAQFPFTFTSDVTFEEFNYEDFLRKHGVYNEGFWRRETNFYHNVPFGELPPCIDDVVLPVESVVLDDPPDTRPARPLVSWQTYYQYRGFSLDSPIAILLQWPLTLHYIINDCMTHDYSINKIDNLSIDILGVEKEVDLLPLFQELGYLNPSTKLNICMYGPSVSKKTHKRQYNHDNTTVTIVRGMYHKVAEASRKPDLVVGFNAGLGAYHQWKETVVKIIKSQVPAYFTDYCQYSWQCARDAVKTLEGATLSEPSINPFRGPIRKLAEENNMPSYSNGFIFHLTYS